MLALLLVQAVAVLLTTLVVWPHLPPLHQDELLPLVPLVRFHKVPDAWGDYVRGLSVTVFGHVLPLRSYVYEGALRALLYAPFFPIRWQTYRATNVVWVFVLFALILCCCRRLGGLRAAVLGCSLLATDVSFVYLGITEQVRVLHFILGVALFLLAAACVERPRPATAAGLAVVVALGVWNKLEFLWFVAAALAATHPAALLRAGAVRALLAIDVAVGVGLLGAYAIVPSYFRLAGIGAAATVAPSALARVGHFADLWPLVAPLGAYHRHVDVTAGLDAAPATTYSAAFLGFAAAVVLGLAVDGVRERRPAWLALAIFPVVLAVLAVLTPFTMHVHHILVVKPFVYAGAAVLAARALGAPRKRVAVLALWAVLLAGSLAANVQAFAAMQHAPPLRGPYGVSANAVDAWQAAVASDVREIRALDWGVFFAGLVSSRRDQRWDMETLGTPDALRKLMAGRERVGLLFRADGPHAWLRGERAYPIAAERVFRTHPGDAWVFLVLAG
ncbi:MAG TPA: hypothetical protein VKA21_06880 [Candidatus Binatia bacterium]|nr:hypothetical protein [Candidatus Binatia bacterium]